VVGFRKSGPPTPSGGAQASTSAPAAPAGTVLKPTGVVTFNPYGKPPGNTENPASLEGNGASIAWSTSYYFNRPNFGGLKPGTGLLINMGKQVRLSQVEVAFSANGGPTTASIYLGNDPTDKKSTALSNFTLVSPSVSVTGDHKFPVSGQATGQYVLIWLTSLPKLANTPQGAPAGNTYYEAQISNVTVTGSAASGNS
jgi:putative peptidoglycan lipid II flippase